MSCAVRRARWLVPLLVPLLVLLLSLVLLPLLPSGASRAQDDDDQPRPSLHPDSSGAFALTASQQQAVGIRVEQPLPMAGARPVQAFGLVLDPVVLVNDAGRVDSTRAASDAAAADVARLDDLYRNYGDASLKALQAARAQSSEAGAAAEGAATTFQLQWGPLAALDARARRELIDSLATGRRLLLRADVPGHQLLDSIAPRALVMVDGVGIAARVLGPLLRTDAQSQGGGWLLQLERGPHSVGQGIGPGARVEVQLQAAPVSGLLVPAAALLYGEQGAYVYRQLDASGDASGNTSGDAQAHYAAAPVTPLVRVGEGWLVRGLGRSDRIVVQGAGVLWSLEGISSFSAAEEEHD
jgi:hypothetical protein